MARNGKLPPSDSDDTAYLWEEYLRSGEDSEIEKARKLEIFPNQLMRQLKFSDPGGCDTNDPELIVAAIYDRIEACRSPELLDFRHALSQLFKEICRSEWIAELAEAVTATRESVVSSVAIEHIGQTLNSRSASALRKIAASGSPETTQMADEAADFIESVIKAHKLFREGCFHSWNFRSKKAEEAFAAASAIDPKGPISGLCRGVVAYDRKKYDDALSEFLAVSADHAWIPDVHVHLGQTYRMLGVQSHEGSLEYFRSSCESFENARQYDPTLSFVDVGLAWTYFKIESSPDLRDCLEDRRAALLEAEVCVNRAGRRAPDDLQVIITYAQLLEKKAALTGAADAGPMLAFVDQLVDFVVDQQTDRLSTLVYAYGAKARRIVEGNSGKKAELNEALRLCNLVRDIAGEQTSSRIFKWSYDAQSKLGRREEALATCKAWVAAYPNDPGGHANLGKFLTDPVETLRCYHRAFSLAPPGSGICSYIIPQLAKCLVQNGKPFEALKVLEGAPEKIRNNYKTQEIIGQARQSSYQIRRTSQAIYTDVFGIFRPARRSPQEWRELLKEKRVVLNRAIESDPEFPKLWALRSRVEFCLHNLQIAARAAETAIGLAQGDERALAEAEVALGTALKGLGRFEDAKSHFSAAGLLSVSEPLKRLVDAELRKLEIRGVPAVHAKDPQVSVLNSSTGKTDTYLLKDLQAFVDHLGKLLPIGNTLSQIGEAPFFLRASTGVGKTVVTPMYLFLKLAAGKNTNETPQVLVVEPRIPIAIDEKRHMNVTFCEFMKEKAIAEDICLMLPGMTIDVALKLSHDLMAEGQMNEAEIRRRLSVLKGFSSIKAEDSDRFVRQIHRLLLAPIDHSGKTGPFGVVSSVATENAAAPVVFVTTGIFEKRALENDLCKELHRILIDEAHITIEQNPGIELAVSLARQAGVCVDFMSATVDSKTLPDDLGVQVLDCQKEQHPIEYRVCDGKLGEVLESLVRDCLVMRTAVSKDLQEWDRLCDPETRAVGMLVVVNSHMAENSDTLRLRNQLKSLPEFRDIDVLRLASPVVRDPAQRKTFNDSVAAIEKRRGRYVIIATNVVEMGITFPSLDFIVTMDTEYVTVSGYFSDSLQLKELGLNALKQRAGRVGRKRPGVCFITKDFCDGAGAWYTMKYSGEEIKKLPPLPIKYPLMEGNLSRLAYVSLAKGVCDQDLERWIAGLALPSKLEEKAHKISTLRKIRQGLFSKGLADGSGITELGQQVSTYVGVDDIDFARMAEMCRPQQSSRHRTGDREMFHVMVAIAALSTVSLGSLFHPAASLQADDRRSRSTTLAATEKIGPFPDAELTQDTVRLIQSNNVEPMDEMLDLGVLPRHAAEIVQLLMNGFHAVTLEEIVGTKPQDGPTRQDKEALEAWSQAVRVNERYIHLEKPVFSFNGQSELLAVYDIVEYFFREFAPLFVGELPGYLREKLDVAFGREAERLEVKKHTVKAAIDSVLKLFHYIRENIPKREFLYDNDLQPGPDDLKLLWTHFVETFCDEQNIPLSKAQSLASSFDHEAAKIREQDYAKLSQNSRIPLSEVTMLMKTVLMPAWNRYLREYRALRFSSAGLALPRLRGDLARRVLEHIRTVGYGTRLSLEQGEISYSTSTKVEGIMRPVHLMTATSSLSLTDKQVSVMGKFLTGIRQDGEEVVTVTHATMLKGEEELYAS